MIKYRGGQVVAVLEPFFYNLSTPLKKSQCEFCFEKTPKATRQPCEGCKMTFYCGSECKAKHLKWHKHECSQMGMIREISQFTTKDMILEQRASFQIFSNIERERTKRLDKPEETVTFDDLEISPLIQKRLGLETNPRMTANAYARKNTEMMQRLFSHLIPIRNRYQSWKNDGFAIYLELISVKPSHTYNVYPTFDGPICTLRAVRDILEDEPLTMPYRAAIPKTNRTVNPADYCNLCDAEKCKNEPALKHLQKKFAESMFESLGWILDDPGSVKSMPKVSNGDLKKLANKCEKYVEMIVEDIGQYDFTIYLGYDMTIQLFNILERPLPEGSKLAEQALKHVPLIIGDDNPSIEHFRKEANKLINRKA